MSAGGGKEKERNKKGASPIPGLERVKPLDYPQDETNHPR